MFLILLSVHRKSSDRKHEDRNDGEDDARTTRWADRWGVGAAEIVRSAGFGSVAGCLGFRASEYIKGVSGSLCEEAFDVGHLWVIITWRLLARPIDNELQYEHPDPGRRVPLMII